MLDQPGDVVRRLREEVHKVEPKSGLNKAHDKEIWELCSNDSVQGMSAVVPTLA